jgi:hypothetical protein
LLREFAAGPPNRERSTYFATLHACVANLRTTLRSASDVSIVHLISAQGEKFKLEKVTFDALGAMRCPADCRTPVFQHFGAVQLTTGRGDETAIFLPPGIAVEPQRFSYGYPRLVEPILEGEHVYVSSVERVALLEHPREDPEGVFKVNQKMRLTTRSSGH